MNTSFLFLLLGGFALANVARPLSAEAQAPVEHSNAPTTEALVQLHERYRVAGLEEREFSPGAFWQALGPLIDRPDGPATVLLWSQMHGKECSGAGRLQTKIVLELRTFQKQADGGS